MYQPLAMRTLSDSTLVLNVVNSLGEGGGGGGLDELSRHPELALPLERSISSSVVIYWRISELQVIIC